MTSQPPTLAEALAEVDAAPGGDVPVPAAAEAYVAALETLAAAARRQMAEPQLVQPLPARVADFCVTRPGIHFTAEEAALALEADLADVTAALDRLVLDGVNGTLTAELVGYVFTDDPTTGITSTCSAEGCTPQAMCADCGQSMIDVLTGEQVRRLRKAQADQARAAALGRRIDWIRDTSHLPRPFLGGLGGF